jgi:hypothetical protein
LQLYVLCIAFLANLPEEGLREAAAILESLWTKYHSDANRVSAVEDEFYRHTTDWLQGIGSSSDPNVIFTHPSYRAIVDMGPDAIPLIDRELAKRSLPLSYAYSEISGTSRSSSEIESRGLWSRLRSRLKR